MSAEYCYDAATAHMLKELIMENSCENKYNQLIGSLRGLVSVLERRIELQQELIKRLNDKIMDLTCQIEQKENLNASTK